MKNSINIPRKEYLFHIEKNDINNNNTLPPLALYKKMETTVLESLSPIKDYLNTQKITFKLNLLKNAFLNDQLKIRHKVVKLNTEEIILSILVYKTTEEGFEIVCDALFGYPFKEKPKFDMAS
jgi:hypothetical protein